MLTATFMKTEVCTHLDVFVAVLYLLQCTCLTVPLECDNFLVIPEICLGRDLHCNVIAILYRSSIRTRLPVPEYRQIIILAVSYHSSRFKANTVTLTLVLSLTQNHILLCSLYVNADK